MSCSEISPAKFPLSPNSSQILSFFQSVTGALSTHKQTKIQHYGFDFEIGEPFESRNSRYQWEKRCAARIAGCAHESGLSLYEEIEEIEQKQADLGDEEGKRCDAVESC